MNYKYYVDDSNDLHECYIGSDIVSDKIIDSNVYLVTQQRFGKYYVLKLDGTLIEHSYESFTFNVKSYSNRSVGPPGFQ